MTTELLKRIYLREYVHGRAIRNGDPELWEDYRIIRNKVTREINNAKRSFYHESVVKARNQKEMWKSLRHLIPSKKT